MAAQTPLIQSLRTAKGNVSQKLKDDLADWSMLGVDANFWSFGVVSRLENTESDLFVSPEEPKKKQVRMAFEIDVTLEMCNVWKSMHGGCTATLIDACSSLAVTLLAKHVMPANAANLSLGLDVRYIAPAPLGCRLKIVNTTVAMGARTMSVRTEVYDKTHKRLVATGTHLKMLPSGSATKL